MSGGSGRGTGAVASFEEAVAVPVGKGFFYVVRNSSVGDYGKRSDGALGLAGLAGASPFFGSSRCCTMGDRT